MKAILQSVGDDTVAFGDQVYWVQENVKRFLNGFQPGMEVELSVKDVDGTPMVTFMKKAGFAPAQGQRPQYGGNSGYQKPATAAPPRPAPAPTTSDMGMYTLAAALITAYQLDPTVVAGIAKDLKKMVTAPPAPPASQPMPPQVMAPPVVQQPVVISGVPLSPDTI